MFYSLFLALFLKAELFRSHCPQNPFLEQVMVLPFWVLQRYTCAFPLGHVIKLQKPEYFTVFTVSPIYPRWDLSNNEIMCGICLP